MLYALALNVRTYCMLYALAVNLGTYCMLGNGLTKKLLVLGPWFYEHLYSTDNSNILLFLLTNVLIFNCFG